ncbi:MerR family transcriptional regulator [Winogradskyella marincola]|uniref:MerR family transcriptional regulator n=2 Tax=Flavobacteriaceae TaxID=49546 RepID=A0ABT6FWU5_9FLAO|nr:MerR family transcriptional regulator [Winogradskyella sp. YYF002]MDG4714263.1 MerR family transcriptional regulator [Winogradskyella sp. YYF002]
MNNIKNQFSIKDLENLTGIKAHTIRIWEKRYNLLQPKRTDTNIRYYDLANFQKLLNVSYLNNNGYKISKIATIQEEEIPNLVKEIANENNLDSHAINAFKLSMLNFDQSLFYKTYESLLKDKDFESIFYTIFIPLLTEIGLLWQTDTITPAHEHFISGLVRQKILINTELLQAKLQNKSTTTFVLYLPENEIHELGLMFVNYLLLKKGYHCIYLGQSVPILSLKDIQSYYDDIVFISYLTVKPSSEDLRKYLEEFEITLLKNHNSKLWLLGKVLQSSNMENLPKQIIPYKSIKSLISTID